MGWARRVMAIAISIPVVAGALHMHNRAHPRLDDFDWRETETGLHAQTRARNAQLVCLCGGYECRFGADSIYTELEPTHIGYKGARRAGFILLRDPNRDGEDQWGRHITFAPACVQKQKGEVIDYTLISYSAPDSAGVNETEYLKLSIK